jgi:hypothetical protein
MRSSLLLIGLALTIGCGDKPADDTGSPSTDDTGPAEPVDADGDGFDVTEDCDDGDPDVHPGADEYCNDIDDDCDEQVDEDDAVDAGTWYSDDDFDGYGDPATARQRCEGRSDEVADGTDCDDSDAAVHPAADEICNDIDDDCDGDIDVDAVDAPTWYLDYDADGYGGDAYTEVSCDQPSGFVDNADDCDDTEVTVYPGADEDTCNEIDDDCDGEIDEWETGEAAAQWYEDSDGDGYGNSAVIELLHPSCDGPSGFVAVGGDCDETDAAVFPGAAEACDGSDNDCDGVTDEDDAVDADPWYADADGDGFGWFYDPAVLACSRPTGYVADNTDCDDGDAAVYPGTATCTWATISDIQTGVYVAGDVVTVVGWVMHDALSVGFHLADDAGAYNGVWVYTNGSTMLEGDEVVLFGEISEYNDLTELIVTAPTTDITLLDSGATLPAATVVPTLDLADPAIAESYEGTLVTVSAVDVEDSDLGYGEWSVDDGVIIDDLIYGYSGDLDVGGSFASITGLLYYSFGNYKILPRYAADFGSYTAPPCLADKCVDDLIVGDLVITEIMGNPDACADSACEWIELYNASGGSVDIDGLVLEDDGGNTATVVSGSVFAAGSYIVLAIGDSTTWAYTGFTPDGFYGSSMALGNSGDSVLIENSAMILDASFVYATAVAGESYNLDIGALDEVSNDDAANWCLSTTAIGSTGDYGTPGAVNESCP